MSCTIFYRGKLKNGYDFKDIVSIVQKHAGAFGGILNIHNNIIEIQFNTGKSEPLILVLDNGKIDGFCKWNGENEEEYYKVLDMFIELKFLFKPLHIEDDLGIWERYLVQSKPCKIIKRSVCTEQEQKLLQRVIDNGESDYSGIEVEILNMMYPHEESSPFSKNICWLIIQDFIKVCNISSLTSKERSKILKLANEISGFSEHFSFTEGTFKFEIQYLVVAIWISYCLSYKNKGIVRELQNEVYGLGTSKLAALFGIVSGFLNCHSGTINQKHAEINKFMGQNILYNNPFALSKSEVKDKMEVELLISVLDYFGFKYEGV